MDHRKGHFLEGVLLHEQQAPYQKWPVRPHSLPIHKDIGF